MLALFHSVADSVQDKVSKVTLFSRRALTSLDGVDLPAEQSQGRLVQHVEGRSLYLHHAATFPKISYPSNFRSGDSE